MRASEAGTTVPWTERRCPRCGHVGLRPVGDSADPNLLCVECRRCWHLEHGHLIQVNPYACPGCPERAFCVAH